MVQGVNLLSKTGLQVGAKAVALDLISSAVGYTVGDLSNRMGLPLPITLILSGGAAAGTFKVASKHVFSDADSIVKVLSGGSKGSGQGDWSKLMDPEDAAKYIQWTDLKAAGFSAEEIYNLEKFGSIKTYLDYKTTTGLSIEGTLGKTTTILGTYTSDTKYIVEELGNIKSIDFGAKNGGLNVLNTPDEFYVTPKQFWAEYNKPWLDNVIQRKDIVNIATEPIEANLYRINQNTGVKELTGFGTEFQYLKDNGYVYDTTTKSMIKD